MAKKPNAKRDLAGITCVQIPLFGGWLMLTLDREQHDRAMAWLGQPKSPDSDFNCLGFCQDFDDKEDRQCIVVHIIDWRLDTLVHELAHATFKILDRRGVETGDGDRETFCYLIDHLFAQTFTPTTQRWQEEQDKKEAKNDPA